MSDTPWAHAGDAMDELTRLRGENVELRAAIRALGHLLDTACDDKDALYDAIATHRASVQLGTSVDHALWAHLTAVSHDDGR
ncbi:MAG: hypothetical protein ACOYOQ_00580 [Microthrixaceae bacterium]